MSNKVNLSAAVRKTIQSHLEHSQLAHIPPDSMFDKARDEATTLLQRDSFISFKETEAFSRFRRLRESEVCP